MSDYKVSLRRYYAAYTVGFFLFVLVLAVLERFGMPPLWIGYSFLFLTIFLYATIGVLARTASVTEYYVAGRRVPAVFNGMATGADWMSSASFMGLAGVLYLTGYQGLAYVMGWTGGYVLVALLLAPYLRRFGQYTIRGFSRCALWRQPGTTGWRLRHRPGVVRLCGGADLWRRPDHQPLCRSAVRDRGLCRPRRNSGLLVPGRHARRDLDAGGAIRDPDRRLSRAGDDSLLSRSPAFRFRS
jgi:hypothetical protein